MLIPHTSPPRGRKTRKIKGVFSLKALAFVPSMWYNFSCRIVFISHLWHGFDYGGNHSQSLFLLPFARRVFIFRRNGTPAAKIGFFQKCAAAFVHAEVKSSPVPAFQALAPVTRRAMADSVPVVVPFQFVHDFTPLEKPVI